MSQEGNSQASDGFDTDTDYTDFDWTRVDSHVDDAYKKGGGTQPSSPIKARQPWRSPGPGISPSTPSKARVGYSNQSSPSPITPSRIGRATPHISQAFRGVGIQDEDSPPPPPKRLLFESEAKKLRSKVRGKGPESSTDGSDEEVFKMLVDPESRRSTASSSRMQPPPIKPLQASSTQSSFISSSSTDSLFSHVSRSSSRSSIASTDSISWTSSLKRGSEGQLTSSPSPSKSRKISGSSPQSAGLTESPMARSVDILSGVETQSSSSSVPGTFSLSDMFGGLHGSALPVHIIADCPTVQREMDRFGIELGVQWELARGVTRNKWSWEQVGLKVHSFKGKNADKAPTVPSVMLGKKPVPSATRDLAVWIEIDREQKALLEGKSRGLGLMGPWEGEPDYHGGQIQYPLRLAKSVEGGEYVVHLEKPEKGRSYRFARELGSASILQLAIPSKLFRDEGEQIKAFLTQKFVLCGRVYMPIPPKDNSSVYLIQTNENWGRDPQTWYGDQYRIPFDEFVRRHNPLDLNSDQPFAKYIARYALGLSTSTPVLEFEQYNIIYIPDIVADGWDLASKPPAEKTMTDGCGFINRSALLLITRKVGYEMMPTAVQGRIGGAKGMWTLHPTDEDPEPKIWIRESQLKIKLRGDLKVHRIFDLLRPSRASPTESRHMLAMQSILCLSYNGIPDDLLISLLVDGLEATVRPLLDWSPAGMVPLWIAINKAGNVSGSRLQRIAGSRSRVLGFRNRDREDGDTEAATNDSEVVVTSSGSGRDHGGIPLSLHEKALEMIQAGFSPASSAYLNDAIRHIVKTEINLVIHKFKISLPESTGSEALVIPDPLGVLEENEIYYRSSNPMKNITTQTLFQTLVGRVILGRYPIRLPCDMQMVTAVDAPELQRWPDVIIASTKGQRSLLSLLSGGDYDGDNVIFIWLEAFLDKFKNQPFTPPPHNLISHNFERKVETVKEVADGLQRMSTPDAQRHFQEWLLKSLHDTQVGIYSWFHDNAVWRHGYGHRKAIEMAYIGNTLLDAGKTGLCLKPIVHSVHKKAFGHERPNCMDHTKNWKGPRDSGLSPFILDSLVEAGKKKGESLLHEYDIASHRMPTNFKEFEKDPDLLTPFKTMENAAKESKWSKLFKAELKAVMAHVDEVRKLYGKAYAISKDRKSERDATLLEMHQKYAEQIPGIESMVDVEELKASYAYSMPGKENFAFAVAFKTLCGIKARASPTGIAPVSRLFDETKTIPGSAVRALSKEDDDYI